MTGFFPKRCAHPDPDTFSQSGVPAKSPSVGATDHFRPLPEEPIRTFFPGSEASGLARRVVLPPPQPEAAPVFNQGSPFELVEPPPTINVDAPKIVTSAVRLPAIASPAARPEQKTTAVTVHAAVSSQRTPLAPLMDEAKPESPATSHPPMVSPDPRPIMSGIAAPAVAATSPTTAPSTATTPSAQAAMPVEDDFGMDFRQLELRAVFGLPGVLSAKGVFALCATLPGIKAAAYVTGESMVFQRAAVGASLAGVPKAFLHLAGLARELGIRDTRLLTLQTEGGQLAFFSEGAGCLAVLHDGRRFAPGVKERLVIILRELCRGSSATA